MADHLCICWCFLGGRDGKFENRIKVSYEYMKRKVAVRRSGAVYQNWVFRSLGNNSPISLHLSCIFKADKWLGTFETVVSHWIAVYSSHPWS